MHISTLATFAAVPGSASFGAGWDEMAKASGKAGKRALAVGSRRPRVSKSGSPKASKSAPRNPEPSAARKQKRSVASELAGLKRQLKAARLQTKEALERQAATSEVLKLIASSPSDVQPVFEAIAESAKRLLGGTGGLVTRVVDDELRVVGVAAGTRAATKAILALFPAPLSSSSNSHSRAAASGRPIIRSDIPNSDLPPDVKAAAAAFGFRSLIVVPMLRGDKAIGTIGVSRTEAGEFSASDVELLKTFADQAAIAIENTRLFNETKEALERQTATAEVLQVISSSISSATPVFERILESTERLITCDNVTIFLAMPDEQLHLAAFRGPGADAVRRLYPRPLAQTTAPTVLAARRQIVYEDAANHPDVSESLREAARTNARGTFSVVQTPLMWEGNAIGMLNVSRNPDMKFKERELSLLRTFADQAVIAIKNARLFDEVQAKTRDLEASLQQQTATADVLKVISRSAFDLQSVLETLTCSAVELSGALRGTIWLRDGDVMRFRAVSHPDLAPEWVRFMQENPQQAGRHSTIGRAIASARTVCTPDVEADPEIRMPAYLAGIRAVLAVPLLRDGRVEGVMALSRQQPGPFTDRQVELVETFADQAVIAIENARLFNEVETKTQTLTDALERQTASADILKVIAGSPSDVQPVFDALVMTARRLLGREMASILLCGDDATFRSVAGAGPDGLIPVNPIKAAPTKIDPDANFPSRAIVSKKNQQLPDWSAIDLPEQERQVREMYGWSSALYLPMLRGEECIGVLLVGGTQAGSFSEPDIALAEILL